MDPYLLVQDLLVQDLLVQDFLCSSLIVVMSDSYTLYYQEDSRMNL